MTPDGRVESKEDDLVETLERDAEVLDRLRSPKSGHNRSLKLAHDWLFLFLEVLGVNLTVNLVE